MRSLPPLLRNPTRAGPASWSALLPLLPLLPWHALPRPAPDSTATFGQQGQQQEQGLQAGEQGVGSTPAAGSGEAEQSTKKAKGKGEGGGGRACAGHALAPLGMLLHLLGDAWQGVCGAGSSSFSGGAVAAAAGTAASGRGKQVLAGTRCAWWLRSGKLCLCLRVWCAWAGGG